MLTTPGANNSLLNLKVDYLTGTCTGSGNCVGASNIFVNWFSVNSGAVTSHSTVSSLIVNAGSSGQVGGIIVSQNTLFLNRTTGNMTNAFYEVIDVVAATNINDNGTTNSPSGSLFDMAWYAQLRTGATNWVELSGVELDYTAQIGSSFQYGYGFHFVLGGDNAVAPAKTLEPFSVGGGSSVPGGNTVTIAYAIGDYSSYSPLSDTATIVGCEPHAGASTCRTPLGTNNIAYGVDLRGFTISGAAFASPSFSVDGSGNMLATSLTSSSIITPSMLGSTSGGAITFGYVSGTYNGFKVTPSSSLDPVTLTTTANNIVITSASGTVLLTNKVGGWNAIFSNDTGTATSTDYFSFHGTSSAGIVYFGSAGSETKVDLGMACKGSSCSTIIAGGGSSSNDGTATLYVTGVANQVNHFTISGNATGLAPYITATGPDSDISLNLNPKGAGTIQVNSTAGVSCTTGTVTPSTTVITKGIVTHC